GGPGRAARPRPPGPLREPGAAGGRRRRRRRRGRRTRGDQGDGGPRMSLLELDEVKVHFPVKRGLVFDRTVGHVYAVDGVSLSVTAGQTYGLVGESGCGKTTLGRAVLRLVDITSGHVVFDGTDLAGLPAEQLRRSRRRLQMVFQDPLGSLNPRQNIESILSE